MDDVFDNPSEHPLIFPPDDEDNYPEKYVEVLKNLAEHSQGYSFLEWTDFDGHNFYGKDRSINLFQSIFAHRRESDRGRTSTALRMYSKWLFDRYYEGGRSDDPEVQQFVQDAIDFQLLAHNMVVLALDWIPRERGLQYKDGQPYADWHTLCLEKAEEIDD